MMNRKSILFALTIFNHLVCVAVLVWTLAPEKVTQAYQVPSPFLGPIYYGIETITSIFDHNLPLTGVGPNDGNTFVLHYDNRPYENVNGYRYDQHEGIDYDIDYEPVLAAAEGVVTKAGWSNAANHRGGYGLRVEIDHENGYKTLYGHLSVITVEVDERILNLDPENRRGIIGISGNTGAVSDCTAGVEVDPLCGSHLHFSLLRNVNGSYKVVNPYGWMAPTPTGTPGPTPVDPWETRESAMSVDLWDNYPAITGNQFSNGPAVSTPMPLEAVRTIDNSDPDYSESYPPSDPTCWQTGTEGFNGDFRYAIVIRQKDWDDCKATWRMVPNETTPAGEYEVYVYIPTDSEHTLSRGVEYTVKYLGGTRTQTVLVSQAAYAHPDNPHNDSEGSWVYIGRYLFNMLGTGLEYVKVRNATFPGDGELFVVAADAIQLAPIFAPTVTPTPTPSDTPTPGTPTATPSNTPTPTPEPSDVWLIPVHLTGAICDTAVPAAFVCTIEGAWTGHMVGSITADWDRFGGGWWFTRDNVPEYLRAYQAGSGPGIIGYRVVTDYTGSDPNRAVDQDVPGVNDSPSLLASGGYFLASHAGGLPVLEDQIHCAYWGSANDQDADFDGRCDSSYQTGFTVPPENSDVFPQLHKGSDGETYYYESSMTFYWIVRDVPRLLRRL